jgi:hypothetical protein
VTGQVWLDLSSLGGTAVSIGIDRETAMSLDRKGFARLYRDTLIGASRREAKAWADKQVADRAAALAEVSA